MNGLDHYLLCPMQCCMNVVLIDEVPKFLASIPSEIMHDIQLVNPFWCNQPNYYSFKVEQSHY